MQKHKLFGTILNRFPKVRLNKKNLVSIFIVLIIGVIAGVLGFKIAKYQINKNSSITKPDSYQALGESISKANQVIIIDEEHKSIPGVFSIKQRGSITWTNNSKIELVLTIRSDKSYEHAQVISILPNTTTELVTFPYLGTYQYTINSTEGKKLDENFFFISR